MAASTSLHRRVQSRGSWRSVPEQATFLFRADRKTAAVPDIKAADSLEALLLRYAA